MGRVIETPATRDGRDDAVLRDVIGVLEEMVQDDWDLDLDRPIGPETRVVADLTFTSIDLVALLSDIEALYERRDWPFEELLMVDGGYVEDLTVAQIAGFLSERGART
jgi:acyl carrier protein